jgi:Flp pilus assembly protein TadD
VLRLTASAVALVALVLVAYGNHFDNGFHFDDSHAIVDNPAIRSLANVPRFFTDATTFSVLPSNQSYRPVLQTTLAIDYWLGGGDTRWVFQATTFAWFLAQMAAMYLLFAVVLSRSGNQDAGAVALLATALFGVHPAVAETVNYVIQRGEILSTLGVVFGLALYAARPGWRRWGLYLLPLIFGVLAKPPALVFPVLLFGYVWLCEEKKGLSAAKAALPSLIVVALLAWWLSLMTPPTHTTGGGDAAAYWLTQPWVSLRYAASAVMPLWLSADHDWKVIGGLNDPRVLLGILFVAALLVAIVRAARGSSTRPIAFGLVWFVVALLPTSAVPLAEVANDHRLFFPFVGLALAVAQGAWLVCRRLPVTAHREAIAAAVVAAVLVAETAGVHARNAVWRTEETLWHDVTIKSPLNGRGHMNYGLALMARGEVETALTYFNRALPLTPNYPLLHINLGIAQGHLGNAAEAERSFTRAIALAPGDWRGHLYYGRWLAQSRRFEAAVGELTLARTANPLDPEPDRLLGEALDGWATQALGESLELYRAGRYRDCLVSASRGLAARPRHAGLHNNLAACHNALGEWDAGITAAREALRLDPMLQIAAGNLAYALQRKQRP